MKKMRKLIIMAIGLALLGSLAYVVFSKKTPLPVEKEALQLIETKPAGGKTTSLHSTSGIYFTFDGPLVIASANVIVNPEIPIIVESGRNSSSTLVVSPKEAWEFGTNYTIVIKAGLSSVNNKELKTDVSYEIEFEAPTDIISF
jgi:hypothetical protein